MEDEDIHGSTMVGPRNPTLHVHLSYFTFFPLHHAQQHFCSLTPTPPTQSNGNIY